MPEVPRVEPESACPSTLHPGLGVRGAHSCGDLGPVTQGYLLGIGTNLDPERNVPAIVEALLQGFGRILLRRFYQTLPIGMESTKPFINFCAFVSTDLGPEACKAACIAIEIALGRDRSHPASKTRDRPADLDLL